MPKQWFVLSEKFIKLSQREQYIILFAGLLVTFLLFNLLVLEPQQDKLDKLNTSIKQLTMTNNEFNLATANAQLEISKDPNEKYVKQIAQYRLHLQKLDQDLLSLTNELISPKRMRMALQDMLRFSPGISLKSFTTLPVVPLVNSNNAERTTENEIELFRHSFQIIIEGSYFELRDYLKNIEQLQWSFYWHEFDYKTSEYPNAQLKIEMYNLNTKQEFIGV